MLSLQPVYQFPALLWKLTTAAFRQHGQCVTAEMNVDDRVVRVIVRRERTRVRPANCRALHRSFTDGAGRINERGFRTCCHLLAISHHPLHFLNMPKLRDKPCWHDRWKADGARARLCGLLPRNQKPTWKRFRCVLAGRGRREIGQEVGGGPRGRPSPSPLLPAVRGCYIYPLLPLRLCQSPRQSLSATHSDPGPRSLHTPFTASRRFSVRLYTSFAHSEPSLPYSHDRVRLLPGSLRTVPCQDVQDP